MGRATARSAANAGGGNFKVSVTQRHQVAAAAKAITERHRGQPQVKAPAKKASTVVKQLWADGWKKVDENGPVEALGEVLEYHRAGGTVDQCVAAYGRVQRWAERQGVSAMPMPPMQFAHYLVTLANYCETKKLTIANILAACAAVQYMHGLARECSPMEDVGVVMVKQALCRRLGRRGKQAAPVLEDVMFEFHGRLKGRILTRAG
jgi:hypothetical protein